MKLWSTLTVAALIVASVGPMATAQVAEQRVYRVGVLAPSEGSIAFFREYALPELARRGFAVGRNLAVIELSGTQDRMADLARELAAIRPDVVVAVSDLAIRAVAAAAPDIPVVMSFGSSDPVLSGFAKSLRQPGGKITGLVMLAYELDAKRLALLHEVVPTARRIAVLTPTRHRERLVDLQHQAERLGVALSLAFADKPADYEPAFQAMKESGAEALLVLSAPEFARDAALVSQMATSARLPTVCEWNYMAREGCLIGYGPSNEELRRRTGAYVAQILRGIPPGEIPIEGPTRFDSAVNLRTAASLGLNVPAAILARADEVIE